MIAFISDQGIARKVLEHLELDAIGPQVATTRRVPESIDPTPTTTWRTPPTSRDQSGGRRPPETYGYRRPGHAAAGRPGTVTCFSRGRTDPGDDPGRRAAGASWSRSKRARARKQEPAEEEHVNVLIVLAHPDPSSFNHALDAAAAQSAREQGHSVVLHDLHAESFDPVLPSVLALRRGPPRPGARSLAGV